MAGGRGRLDIETGGGEVLATRGRAAGAPGGDRGVAAQRRGGPDRLHPLGCPVVAVADAPTLPFVAASFDLVVSRHPVVVLWDEIARVLRPGGTYLSQQIGPGTNRELTDFMMGPQPVNESRSAAQRPGAAPRRRASRWSTCGSCALRVEFFDVGAVVHFLRKVHWTVPGFTPEAYEAALRRLHAAHRAGGRPSCRRPRRLLVEALVDRRRRAGTRRMPRSPARVAPAAQLAWLTVLML